MPIKLSGIKTKTPVDSFNIGKRVVYVKRDDLMGDNALTPSWGKLEGVYNVLKGLDLNQPLIHHNPWGSWSGWTLAYLASELGFDFLMTFPKQKTFSDEYIDIVQSFGSKILPLKPNVTAVLYSQTKRFASDNGYQILPYGFDTPAYYNYMVERVKKTLKKSSVKFDHLVVSSGSGVTCTALADGFFSCGGKQMHTVCVSSEATVKKMTVKHLVGKVEYPIFITKSEFDFKDRMAEFSTPFPCNELWDKKAWHWLEQNIKSLKGNILFWNLGGTFDF